MTKGIVVYDSFTGNTKKVAEAIASANKFKIVKVDDAPRNLKKYNLLVLGTLNIRGGPTPKINNFLKDVIPPEKFALFLTFGLPFWGYITSLKCLNNMRKQLDLKGSKYIGKFICPGYHAKFKTYKNRPSNEDLEKAKNFSKSISDKL